VIDKKEKILEEEVDLSNDDEPPALETVNIEA
jgi:hypothetical protein